MDEGFALQYADRRVKERGFKNYRVVYREFVLPGDGTLSFQAHNEIWLVLHIDWGLIVKSDYGRYDHWYTQGITENSHEHGDKIQILNTLKEQRKIRFLQVILKTNDDGGKK